MSSNTKLNDTYGIPTILGILLTAVLGISMWFSVFNDSNPERLLFTTMLVIGIIHMLEESYPIRMIEIKSLTTNLPFCSVETKLIFEIRNLSKANSQELLIKLNREDEWIGLSPIIKNSSKIIELPFTFKKNGENYIPTIRITSYSCSYLNRFFRYIDTKSKILVLPTPIDYKIEIKAVVVKKEEHELTNVEEIHEPSRFKFTDPKLFQKTNKRYQRVFTSKEERKNITYNWDSLSSLSHKQKGEQFSFWIKCITRIENKETTNIIINTPFIKLSSQANLIDIVLLKKSFSTWYYGKN